MKNIILSTLILGLLINFNSCEGFWGIVGEGPIAEEEFAVNSFTSVQSGIQGNIHLIQDNDPRIIVKAQQNIIDNLEFSVKGNRLKIRNDKNVLSYEDIDVYIYNDHYEQIALSGSGIMENDTPLDVYGLEVKLSGSGEIILDDVTGDLLEIILSGSGTITLDDFKDFDKIYSSISGSGNIDLDAKGTLKDQEINISGSGNIKAFKTPSKNIEAYISGSGYAEIWAIDYLEVNISGSGSIYYKGSPQIDSNISGSGSVIDEN